MGDRKPFFESSEWQAFVRPFKQFFSLFTKKKSAPVTKPIVKNKISQPIANKVNSEKNIPVVSSNSAIPIIEKSKEPIIESVKKVEEKKEVKVEVKQPSPEELLRLEKEREAFLLSQFEKRKLEREKRREKIGEFSETIIEEDRPSLLELEGFTRYSLEDLVNTEPEEKAPPKRECVIPEGGLRLPETSLLEEIPLKTKVNQEEINRKMEVLQDTLDSFRVDARVSGSVQGPRITRIEIRPAQGVNVDSIAALSKNMAMELEVESLRILAPIPGKPFVGVEIPNDHPEKVALRELLESQVWLSQNFKIPLALGKNTSGEMRFLDLAKAPHLLIAGATGAGKSVCINTIIMSMIFRFSPEDLELILVDPKVVELTAYQELPHLISPVITDTSKVAHMLKWVVGEMKRRYKILALAGARNIEAYNSRANKEVEILDEDEMPIPAKFPFMVIIIDELADIMMTAGVEVETALAQIAQLSRAVGIHTIIATQRPSVNVITGIIKANYPTRIAFQVSSQIDSRTILDGKGAEQLLGRGDMLFSPPGAAILERIQGALVEDAEIETCVKYLAQQMKPAFEPRLETILTKNFDHQNENSNSGNGEADDDLVKQAIEIIVRDRKASTSYIQRRLRIGYNRAAIIMEKLEEMGVVGPQIGSGKREILIDTGA